MINGIFPTIFTNAFDRSFNDIVSEFGQLVDGLGFKSAVTGGEKGTYLPSVYRFTEGEEDVIYVDLPGCKRENVSASFEVGKGIRVEGVRVIDGKEYKYAVNVNSALDVANAKCKYEDGMMTIRVRPLPKDKPEAKKLSVE